MYVISDEDYKAKNKQVGVLSNDKPWYIISVDDLTHIPDSAIVGQLLRDSMYNGELRYKGKTAMEIQEAEKAKKPPLGLKPMNIHNHQRHIDIVSAIERYVKAGKKIPGEWLSELKYLVTIG